MWGTFVIIGLANKFFYPYMNYVGEANFLVEAARIHGVGWYIPLLNRHPDLRAIADNSMLEYCDYLITIACVGTAFMEIADTVPEGHQRGLTHAIQDRLVNWAANSYDMMSDFIKYTITATHAGVVMPEAIGAWVFRQIESNLESTAELKKIAHDFRYVAEIGLPILAEFHNWWRSSCVI